MAEAVRHNTDGLLFEPGSSRDLARQMQRILEEPPLLDTLRDGINPVRCVDSEIEELVSIYTALVQASPANSTTTGAV
jgi:hypothetical protein